MTRVDRSRQHSLGRRKRLAEVDLGLREDGSSRLEDETRIVVQSMLADDAPREDGRQSHAKTCQGDAGQRISDAGTSHRMR